MKTLEQKIRSLPADSFVLDSIRFRIIQGDMDLWYAVMECRLAPGQDAYVNPAGFSIGRAYLCPDKNIPCVILKETQPIGYIVLREWFDGSANSWSYYLDRDSQGQGWGKIAARLAVKILKAADPSKPIKLSAEQDNRKAHHLYQNIGFHLSGETDGDDLVFIYEEGEHNDLSR